MPDIGDFIRRSAKIAIALPGTPGDFRRSRRSAYKIAKCVAGFKVPIKTSILSGTAVIAAVGREVTLNRKRRLRVVHCASVKQENSL